MDTLNPYVKINKHPLGRWASIKSWFHWKLQMSKMPWGKIYRHFWRKRLMKRITEVANEINRRSVRGLHDFDYLFPEATGKFGTDILTPVGYVPMIPPLGLIEHPVINPAQLDRRFVVPAGVAVMDPTKIYKITPDITLPEFPVIRRRICHLRKKKIWKFHMKPC